MDPNNPEFIQELVIQDYKDSMIETAVLAALLTMVNNGDESSDDYDSEYDYEEVEELYEEEEEYDEEEEEPLPLPRKRGRSELRDETPCPIAQEPQNKRVRLGATLVNEESTISSHVDSSGIEPRFGLGLDSSNPGVGIPKPDFSQLLQPLYSPEQVVSFIPNDHPFNEIIVKACIDLASRFRGKTSEKNLAIMATRLWRQPVDARMYNVLNDKNKQVFFEKWVGEVRLGQWMPRDAEGQVPKPAPVRNERLHTQLAAPVPRRDQGNTMLRADALKQIDASSKGKLEERVRLWLDNVKSAQGQDVRQPHARDGMNANTVVG